MNTFQRKYSPQFDRMLAAAFSLAAGTLAALRGTAVAHIGLPPVAESGASREVERAAVSTTVVEGDGAVAA